MEQRTAADVMMEFAERTGVTGEAPPKRYLWTDAFAVCNFVGLWRDTGEERYRPLDGYVTYLQLQTTAERLSGSADGPGLSDEVGRFSAMIKGRDFTTTDELGLGGLLIDAYRLYQLGHYEGIEEHDLLHSLAQAALAGLEGYKRGQPLDQPATRRIAFRELGLAIGLGGAEQMVGATKDERGAFATEAIADEQVRALGRYVPMRDSIVGFWQEPQHRQGSTFTEHLDINEVMLASALAPEGCTRLQTCA